MKFPLLINFKDFHLHINILFIVASEVKFQNLRLSKKLVLKSGGGLGSEKAIQRIVELSKKNRDLISQLESEKNSIRKLKSQVANSNNQVRTFRIETLQHITFIEHTLSILSFEFDTPH